MTLSGAVLHLAASLYRGIHPVIHAHGDTAPWLQQFRDLHGVQRCALEQLIARNPKRKAVLESAVHTHATYLTIVLAGNIQRHRITIALRFIDQLDPRRFGQNFAGAFD